MFAYAGEDQFYAPGNKRFIASVNGWKINLLICYDLRFPVWARQQITETLEYDLLIYVANWPERRNHAWKTLLTARAIENQCYVIGVNRVGEDANGINHSGDSMLVDPLGQILYHGVQEEAITTSQSTSTVGGSGYNVNATETPQGVEVTGSGGTPPTNTKGILMIL